LARLSLLFILFLSCALKAQVITTIAGKGVPGYSGDGGAATVAALYYPAGIVLDGKGNLYFADHSNSCIRKINSSGVISTVAGNGTSGYSGDGGPATGAQLCSNLWGIAVDNGDNIYIADKNNQRIRKVNSSGIISTIAGTGTYGFSGDGGPATLARINGISGVASDNLGNIYICDQYNHRIRKIDTRGIITTIAGNGSEGFGGDGGPATAAILNFPSNVFPDNLGNLYIADQANNRIRKINASGIINTIAGNGTTGYSGDGGQAINAAINYPGSVKVDARGNVYIADSRNYRVRKIDGSGMINTIIGNGTAGFSGDGGLPALAEIDGPWDIAIDSSGIIYIGDCLNNRIRAVICAAISANVLPVTCYGNNDGNITVNITGGSGAYHYTWSNGDSLNYNNAIGAGTYLLRVTDSAAKCTATYSFIITQPDSIQISADIKNDACETNIGSIHITVIGGIPPYSYLWSNGITDTNLGGLPAGTYGVVVTDNNTCQKNYSFQVEEDTCVPVIVHDVITPNGDGINDVWVIEGIQNYPKNTVQVFDKEGDRIYEQNNYNNDWGGHGNNGEKLPDGTYFYVVKLNANNNNPGSDVYKGSLLIKR